MFSALRYPDYRRLWVGMLVGNVGAWTKMVAQGWLVYTLTDSPLYLGLVGFARAVPVFALVPLTGVLADRLDRRWLMLAGTIGTIISATILGVLTLGGWVNVWHVLVLAVVSAVSLSLEMPSRQSLIPEMVERKDLINAVGLGAASFNGAGIVGPALAAIMIETTGLATPFLFCAVSNLGVAIALVTMKPVQHQTRSEASFYQNLVEGLGYVRRTPAIFGLMGLMSVFALLGRPYVELMPVFARDVLAIGASGLGALNALIGVGSFIGSVAVASLGNYRRKGRLIIGSAIIFSILLTTFSISTWVPLSLVIAPILGFFTLFYMVGTNTLIQSTVPGALRGRVASIYGLVQMGLMPMGIMLEGAVGSLIGVPITVVGGGLVVLVCSGLGLLAVPALRRLE